ncbi:hypothetical protein EDB81DRAFT_810372 [Dactylonectria macrodidyma]|uniref:Zn(2)-C6 fungal-type domain-containing protein n=1 Tax=Dactylonectria macrodidyma TaxID=307937 RepID=A0A9P9IML3_9HYPO|nr:hypothetical protein EDB81DRAFT_810372 [Dactylonectria macrodidyma]
MQQVSSFASSANRAPGTVFNPSSSPSLVDQVRDIGDSQTQQLSTRVCDNCIRQKVKCDLGRPVCSRCFERGYACIYSSTRRRPGPLPGSKRKFQRRSAPSSRSSRSRARNVVTTDYQLGPLGLQSPEEQVLPSPSSALAGADALNQPSGASESSSASPGLGIGTGNQYSDSLDILPQEEEYLLNKYFETIHDAIPLFSEARLPLDGSGASTCSRDLILTLLIITAKISDFTFASDGFDLGAHIDLTLSSASLQEDMFGDSPTLDQFRKFCLLAFYEFHQFPGQQAWMRIGKLVRIAYWMGLDRLDMLPALSPDWNTVSEDDLEGWRLVWWCVYRLDSYANLSAGTPYQINEMLVNTALLRGGQIGRAPGSWQQDSTQPRVYLPYRQDSLLELLPAIIPDSPETVSFNLHITTVTSLRYIGRALHLRSLAPNQELVAAIADAERRLSALRLALPKNFFNPKRNAFMNESCSSHHARLVSALHLLMGQLLAALIRCGCLPEGEDWLLSWQHVLEVCQDVAAIAKQWSSTFSLSVDPAISLIAFTALIFLDLHKKFAGVTSTQLESEIEHCETFLLLQLEQLAGSWTLPSLLILSFKSFKASLTGPLSYSHILAVLSRFESPLHPRWLQFMSSAHVHLENCQ